MTFLQKKKKKKKKLSIWQKKRWHQQQGGIVLHEYCGSLNPLQIKEPKKSSPLLFIFTSDTLWDVTWSSGKDSLWAFSIVPVMRCTIFFEVGRHKHVMKNKTKIWDFFLALRGIQRRENSVREKFLLGKILSQSLFCVEKILPGPAGSGIIYRSAQSAVNFWRILPTIGVFV